MLASERGARNCFTERPDDLAHDLHDLNDLLHDLDDLNDLLHDLDDLLPIFTRFARSARRSGSPSTRSACTICQTSCRVCRTICCTIWMTCCTAWILWGTQPDTRACCLVSVPPTETHVRFFDGARTCCSVQSVQSVFLTETHGRFFDGICTI